MYDCRGIMQCLHLYALEKHWLLIRIDKNIPAVNKLIIDARLKWKTKHSYKWIYKLPKCKRTHFPFCYNLSLLGETRKK